jgi:predicted enzyme related to lactoylglutathione lyase
MTVKLAAVVLGATTPNKLGPFWAHALGWDVRETDDDGITLVPTDATSFTVEVRPMASAKVGQNRIHFDLTTVSLDDQHRTVVDLLAAGATHIDIGQGVAATHVVLADPEGNEFCVIEPHNRFLASCPRLGAVNCDGTHALGRFWSEALAWPLVWDHEEETAIQAPDGTGPKITWSGPPLMPKQGEERFHFHVVPAHGTGVAAALDDLVAIGATRLDNGRGCRGALALSDVDGNRFCLIEP